MIKARLIPAALIALVTYRFVWYGFYPDTEIYSESGLD